MLNTVEFFFEFWFHYVTVVYVKIYYEWLLPWSVIVKVHWIATICKKHAYLYTLKWREGHHGRTPMWKVLIDPLGYAGVAVQHIEEPKTELCQQLMGTCFCSQGTQWHNCLFQSQATLFRSCFPFLHPREMLAVGWLCGFSLLSYYLCSVYIAGTMPTVYNPPRVSPPPRGTVTSFRSPLRPPQNAINIAGTVVC